MILTQSLKVSYSSTELVIFFSPCVGLITVQILPAWPLHLIYVILTAVYVDWGLKKDGYAFRLFLLHIEDFLLCRT